jgi:hypothetical protein
LGGAKKKESWNRRLPVKKNTKPQTDRSARGKKTKPQTGRLPPGLKKVGLKKTANGGRAGRAKT